MLEELQVLNYLLNTGDTKVITTKGLTSEYFPSYKSQFNFINQYFRSYNKIPDKETVLKKFPDFELIEVNGSIDYLIKKLHDGKVKSAIVTSYNEIRKLLMSDDIEGSISTILNLSNNLTSGSNLEAVDILSDISRYDEYIAKCNDFNKYYITTGFPELDKIIGGWDRLEEYATVIARTGVGKSWLLLYFLTAAVKKGLRVGLYSGEMSVNKVGYRVDTLLSHISNGKLTHGNISAANEYKMFLDDLKENHKGACYVLTRDMIDGKATVDVLRGFVEKYTLDILFIDQHSLLDDRNNARNTIEAAANISKDIKVLQTVKRIPIITVSQQNRNAIEEGKSAGSENVSNSDRIGQDSTVILSLSQKDGIMKIHIAKSRDGGTGVDLNYSVDFDKGILEYIDEGDSSESGDELRLRYASTGDIDDPCDEVFE